MQETGEDFGGQDEDTEIQNLPLYTERKAEGIYRYRRRVPKNLVERVGKGLPSTSTRVALQPTKPRTSQHRPKASAVRLTTGLG